MYTAISGERGSSRFWLKRRQSAVVALPFRSRASDHRRFLGRLAFCETISRDYTFEWQPMPWKLRTYSRFAERSGRTVDALPCKWPRVHGTLTLDKRSHRDSDGRLAKIIAEFVQSAGTETLELLASASSALNPFGRTREGNIR